MKICLFILMMLGTAGSLLAAQAEPTTFGSLASMRAEIAFPRYTPAEQTILAEQVRMALEGLYVNRFLKDALYGDGNDPLAQIAGVVHDAPLMTTAELELSLQAIFASQRDGHLNFFFPAPYACYASLLPFRLVEVFAADGAHRVVVQGLRDLGVEIPRLPEIGDELLSYDGLGTEEAIQREILLHGGSNLSGGYAQALYTLTIRDHRFHPVPGEDEVRLTFRSHRGEIYAIRVPWTVRRDDTCAARARNRPSPDGGRDPLAEGAARELDTGDPAPVPLSTNAFQALCAAVEREHGLTPALLGLVLQPTSMPELSWAILENRHGRFGYLRLTSFFTRGSQAEQALSEIARLLRTELSATDGLVFDVRENPGGTVDLADRLPQLFAPRDVAPLGARLVNTALNAHVLNDSSLGTFPTRLWANLINEVAGTARRYTGTGQFTDMATANELGQLYYRPVAVLMNANTFSAAELFVAGMQDNQLATIWGEDLKSGGGGAQVMPHSQLLALVGEPFARLPGGQDLWVAWRQFVRGGASAGQPLDELGVTADFRARASVEDLLDGGTAQLDRITADLAWKAATRSAWIRLTHRSRVDYSIDDVVLGATVAGTDRLQVYVDGALRSILRPSGPGPQSVAIAISGSSCTIGKPLPVEIRGFAYGEQAYRAKRTLNILGHKVTPAPEGLRLDFSTAIALEPIAVSNIRPWINSTPENGWRLRNGALGIGNGVQYKKNVKSDASLVLDLTARSAATLAVEVEAQTEPSFDYVEIYLTQDDSQAVLARLSGSVPRQTLRFDLSAFAGKDDVALHFLFFSDGYKTERGVEIHGIQIQ